MTELEGPHLTPDDMPIEYEGNVTIIHPSRLPVGGEGTLAKIDERSVRVFRRSDGLISIFEAKTRKKGLIESVRERVLGRRQT